MLGRRGRCRASMRTSRRAVAIRHAPCPRAFGARHNSLVFAPPKTPSPPRILRRCAAAQDGAYDGERAVEMLRLNAMACVRRRFSALPREIGFGRSKRSPRLQGAGRRSPVAHDKPTPAHAALPRQNRNDLTQHRLADEGTPCRAEPIRLDQKETSGTFASIDIGLCQSRNGPPYVRAGVRTTGHIDSVQQQVAPRRPTPRSKWRQREALLQQEHAGR